MKMAWLKNAFPSETHIDAKAAMIAVIGVSSYTLDPNAD